MERLILEDTLWESLLYVGLLNCFHPWIIFPFFDMLDVASKVFKDAFGC